MSVGKKELAARQQEDHLRLMVANADLRRRNGELVEAFKDASPEAADQHFPGVAYPSQYTVIWEALEGLVDWSEGRINDALMHEKARKVRDHASLYFDAKVRNSLTGRKNKLKGINGG